MNSKNKPKSEVLYQKLGNVWYLFSTANDGEVIFTTLPDGVDPKTTELELYEVIEKRSEKAPAPRKNPEIAA